MAFDAELAAELAKCVTRMTTEREAAVKAAVTAAIAECEARMSQEKTVAVQIALAEANAKAHVEKASAVAAAVAAAQLWQRSRLGSGVAFDHFKKFARKGKFFRN